jgi:AAA family ATP:ADP antiporter
MSALRRFVDIRAGERRPVILCAAVLFSMVGGHMMLETARDALFLGQLEAERLPLVYAALAGLALVATSGSDRLVRLAGRRNALVTTLTIAVYGTVLFFLLPATGPVVFALYLWSGLIGTVVVIQFWIFVGQLFTVDQAKRVFGLLAAGGALGALAGASASRFIVEVAPLEILLPSGAGMFMIAAFALTSFPPDGGPAASDEHQRKTAGSLRELFGRYPYLGKLIGLIVIATATVLIVDYLFKEAATRHVDDPRTELGPLFATYYAIFAAASLVFQLAGAGFLLRRLGVLSSLLVMPVLLLFGGAGTALLGGALVGAVIAKGVDGSLRHSLHRVSTELLWMPLPGDVRARAKGLLDAGLTRGVQAGTAAALLGLAAIGWASPAILGSVVAGLAVLWVILALSLRRPYVNLYRQGLARRSVESLAELDLNSLEVLVEALSSADDREVIAAMKLLAGKNRSRLIPSLILYHGSTEVLLEALRLVATDQRDDWIPIARKLLGHEDELVRANALGALARRGELPADLTGALDDVSDAVRARSVFWQVQLDQGDDPAGCGAVRDLLAEPVNNAVLAELLRAIAEDGDGRWSDLVLELLDSPDPEIGQLAVSATAVLGDTRFIPLLIGRLGQRRGRSAVRTALLEIGEPALEALCEALRDRATSAQVRVHLPRSIALFKSPEAARFLLEHLAVEPLGLVRYRVLKVLARLVVDIGLRLPRELVIARLAVNLREYFRLLALEAPLSRGTYELPPEAVESSELLRGLLADKLTQSLERCFLLLQIAHPTEDISAIEAAVRGGDKRNRANALEFVENLTMGYRRYPGGAEVREQLRLALDDLGAVAKLRRLAESVTIERPETYDASIVALAHDSDQTTAAIAVYHALLLDVPHLVSEVEALVTARAMLESVGAEIAGLSGLAPRLTSDNP